jgi:hypothetical protein
LLIAIAIGFVGGFSFVAAANSGLIQPAYTTAG